MKVLTLIVALALVMSQPKWALSAQEELPCIPAKLAIRNLITNQYALVLYREEDDMLVALFANRGGYWVEIVIQGEMVCPLREGSALFVVRERKA